jgi:hypothetical protein
MINMNMMRRKKKGVLDMKVERTVAFDKNVEVDRLFDALTEMRREVAFLLNGFVSFTLG